VVVNAYWDRISLVETIILNNHYRMQLASAAPPVTVLCTRMTGRWGDISKS
jgi:hypothetical protein